MSITENDSAKTHSHPPTPEEEADSKKASRGSHTVKKHTTAYPGGRTLTRKRRRTDPDYR